jgi:serine/threonine-protein kinase RsbW
VTTEQPHPHALADETCSSAQVRSQAVMTEVVEAVTSEMRGLRYPPQDVFAVWLCLEEAIVNALKHGNRSDPRKPVRVRYRVTPERVLAVVADEGSGFDPAKLPNPLTPENRRRPGGRGIFLMRMYMTSVAFNARGNEVTLCRVRSPAAGSDSSGARS